MTDVSGPRMTPTGYAASRKWDGRREKAGDQFTIEQRHEMERRRPAARWDVRMVKIKRPRERTTVEAMAHKPIEECFDLIEVACPILHRGLEHDTVITPGGDTHNLPVKIQRKGRRR